MDEPSDIVKQQYAARIVRLDAEGNPVGEYQQLTSFTKFDITYLTRPQNTDPHPLDTMILEMMQDKENSLKGLLSDEAFTKLLKGEDVE